MEINASTSGANAASALLGSLNSQAPAPTVPTFTADQQTAIQTAVAALLTEAAIGDADPVEVHFAASPEGKWAVLRVAVVR